MIFISFSIEKIIRLIVSFTELKLTKKQQGSQIFGTGYVLAGSRGLYVFFCVCHKFRGVYTQLDEPQGGCGEQIVRGVY